MTTSTVAPRTAVGTARDGALLIARIGLGVLMLAHAWLEYDFAGRSDLFRGGELSRFAGGSPQADEGADRHVEGPCRFS